jgi:hypothetical protein
MESPGSGQGPAAGFSEQGDETSPSAKEFVTPQQKQHTSL